MIKPKNILPFVLIFTSTLFSTGIHFKGSFFTDLGLNHYLRADKDGYAEFRGISSLRLAFLNVNRRFAKFECNADVNTPFGHYLDPLNSASSDSLLSGTLFFEDSAKSPVRFDLRKLYMSLYLPFADITLGRQIINFGKGYLFSPIDAFSSVELTDLSFRRSGSDIAMAAIPIGELSGIDVVVELPFLDNTHSSAVKAFATVVDWDFSLIGIYRNTDDDEGHADEMITGLAFKGDLAVGVHGEIVTHFNDVHSGPSFEAMAGTDYSIRDMFVFIAEYLYKDHTVAGFWGEHNAFGSIQYFINDIMSLSGSLIHNFSSGLSMGTLQYNYNILQNAYVTGYVRVFNGSPLYDAEYAIRVTMKF